LGFLSRRLLRETLGVWFLGFSKLEVTRETLGVWYTRRILGFFFKLEDTQHSIYPRSAYSGIQCLATYRNEGLYATLQHIGQYIEH